MRSFRREVGGPFTLPILLSYGVPWLTSSFHAAGELLHENCQV